MNKRNLLTLWGISLFFLGFLCPWLETGESFWGEAMVIARGDTLSYLAGYNTTLGWLLVAVLALAISFNWDYIKKKFNFNRPLVYKVQLFLGLVGLVIYLTFFFNFSLVGYGLYISLLGGAIIFVNSLADKGKVSRSNK